MTVNISYWFGCRDFDPQIDFKPTEWGLKGPYKSTQEAYIAQGVLRESGLKFSAIFPANTDSEAMIELERGVNIDD